jgi:hypothetical protein
VSGLSPEQADFFNRAERVYGTGHLSAAIEDARDDLSRRNERGTVVKGGNPVIGFVPEKKTRKPSSDAS